MPTTAASFDWDSARISTGEDADGTGKTEIIATLTCCALGVRRTIVLTPRKALVEQMIRDLAWRFWKRFEYCFHAHALRPRAELKEERLIALEKGRVHSIEILRNEGYQRIWANRDAGRQVIVGTFNALHAVLGLEPPAHRSMEGKAAREPSAALDECKLEPGDQAGADKFRKLLRETDGKRSFGTRLGYLSRPPTDKPG